MSDKSSDENINPEVIQREERARAQRDGEYEILPRCLCGGKAIIITSFTVTNPGRRFYSCERVDDNGCHIWKWWDEEIMEEIQELKEEILNLHDRMRYYSLGDNDEIVDPRMMWRNVIVHGNQICLLKDMIQGFALSYGELTEEIVCIKRLGKDKR